MELYRYLEESLELNVYEMFELTMNCNVQSR